MFTRQPGIALVQVTQNGRYENSHVGICASWWDQLNSLHYFQGRLLRGMDQRLTKLERDSRLFGTVSEFVDPLPEADAELCAAVARSLLLVNKPVAVVSCGGGAIVAALEGAGIPAHGVDEMGAAIMAGCERRTRSSCWVTTGAPSGFRRLDARSGCAHPVCGASGCRRPALAD